MKETREQMKRLMEKIQMPEEGIAQLLEARKELEEAVAGLIPKLTVNSDYKYYFDLPYQLMPLSTFNPTAPAGQFKEAQFGVPHNLNLNIQFAMPLFNAQILGGMKTTKIGAEMSELQQKRTEEQVFFDISNLYYNAQILQKQKAFIDSNLLNTNKLLQNMQLLHTQDMLKESDVTKVELQKAQLQTLRLSFLASFLQFGVIVDVVNDFFSKLINPILIQS